MENFVKTNNVTVTYVNDVKTYVAGGLMPHSLVLFKSGSTARGEHITYNVLANCKRSEVKYILKALIKATLEMERVYTAANNTNAATTCGKTAYNAMRSALSCDLIGVTNKDGMLISSSVWSAPDETRLGKAVNVPKTKKLYKLFVEERKGWDDPAVIEQLNAWVTATIEQSGLSKAVDAALASSADSNLAEHDALDAAEKAAKAKAKAKAEEKAEKKAA